MANREPDQSKEESKGIPAIEAGRKVDGYEKNRRSGNETGERPMKGDGSG
jgi:hypothetical protein